MAIIYVSSMDQYGTDTALPYNDSIDERGWEFVTGQLIGDAWTGDPIMAGSNSLQAQGSLDIDTPAWGARQGDFALVANGFRCQKTNLGGFDYLATGTECFRLAVPGVSRAERLIHFAFSCSDLPGEVGTQGNICQFYTDSGDIIMRLNVDPTGRIRVLDGTALGITGAVGGSPVSPLTLVASASPVIQPQTWYYFSVRVTYDSITPAMDIEVYVGDIALSSRVISATGLGTANKGEVDIVGFLAPSFGAFPASGGSVDETIRAVRDIVICDNTGTYNNDLLGQVFVSAQEMRDSDPGAGWEPHPRQKIGTGILDHVTNRTGLRFADAAALALGSGDFTFETFARFDTLPLSDEYQVLVSKWRAAAGARSYRLYLDGVDNTLVWDVSTDGAATIEVKRVPWTPITDRWYHVAVSRASGQTMLFIDGVQIGVPLADANTYFDDSSFLGIGVEFTSGGAPETDGRLNGWLDETRFTVGTARYTTDFTPPTAAFTRGVSDPDWSDVVLLLGYDDTAITDESSFNRTVTLNSPNVTTEFPADGAADYLVLNQRPAWDDTYVEAPLLPATGVFTFEAVPTAGETLTIGATVYTWRVAFTGSPAYEVIIGATVADCVSNIIAAINAGAGVGVVYGTGTAAHPTVGAIAFLSPQFSLQALAAGAAGNSIATTDTMANGFFGSATLTGGQDIPDPSDFAIERLPLDTTGVLGVQMTTRAYKTDAGSAQVRYDLVGPSAGVDTGTPATIDLNPAWVRQVFEEDPDTSAAMTPSTLNSGRIRFVRTA